MQFNLFLLLSEASLCWLAYLATSVFLILHADANPTPLFALRAWVSEEGLELLVSALCVLVWLAFLLLAFPMLCLILVQQKNLLLGRTTYERFSRSS
jgi:hypothetical protein